MINFQSVGFIGSGKMAEALIKGIIDSGLVEAQSIYCSDIFEERLDYLVEQYNISKCLDNKSVVSQSDMIVLSVKPQNMNDLLPELSATIANKPVISIAAGITIEFIRARLSGAQIIRVMPNTPCLLGEGMTGIAPDDGVNGSSLEFCKKVLESVGKIIVTEEKNIDAVTGISGSGPAFVYEIAKRFAVAGEKHGLSFEESLLLITQTLKGAALMIEKTDSSVDDLIKMVSSPGGTTIAGLEVLQNGKMAEIINETVAATVKRSIELSNG